ncbi:MAG: TnpV protein [Bacilli bacterium]|nr:TnpV protein [Bacilli bacterium]
MIIMKKEIMLKGEIIMNLTYKKIGDYILPNLVAQTEEQFEMGKYSIMRLQYLKEHKKATYEVMLMKGTLVEHLKEIEQTSQTRIQTIMNKMIIELNITEQMKQENQMKWVGMMNNIKQQAEEVAMKELIYI